MSENAAELKCPRCGAMLNASVANGICPACLLKQAAMGTGTDSFPAMPWTPPSVAELASAFPQLEVLELIGHGGMGAVYKARQKSLGRLVALKILAPQHAANPDFAERFEREAKALAEVSHPNIVTVYDFGRAGEFYFLTMEFVDGVNLRQAMTAGRLTPSQALAIVPPICEALQFAHDRGIVHRDIKPENLLLDKDGRIKIADFGIARMLRGGDTRQSLGNAEIASKNTAANRATEADLTQESILGTPGYMAPEQRDHPASVDHRADIFSLGVVLYEMLTGELPGSKLQPPSRKVEIDVRLDEIVLRALEKQPELRFQTASDFRTQVTTFVSGDAVMPVSPIFEATSQPSIPFTMRTPGVLMLLMGVLFVPFFLFGGGVVTSSHGSFSTAVFFAAYMLGLLFPGILVYHSVIASACGISNPSHLSAKTKRRIVWVATFLTFLCLPAWMAFFRSAAFATSIGQNAFLIFIGVSLAQFIPLGLALLHRGPQDRRSDQSPESPLPDVDQPEQVDWTLWSPAQSRRAAEICVHMTREEKAHASWMGALFGLWNAATFFLPFFAVMFVPQPLGWIFGGLIFVTGLAFYPLLLKMQREALLNTAWAQQQKITTDQIRRHKWAGPEIAVVAGGLVGIAGLIFITVIGWNRVYAAEQAPTAVLSAALIIGIISVVTVWMKLRRRETAVDNSKTHFRLSSTLLLAAFIILAVGTFKLLTVLRLTNSIIATAFIQPSIEESYFSLQFDVECPSGWNVWVTLENAQLFMADDPASDSGEPMIVSRYQAKLTEHGHVQIPLDYLPTDDENRDKMLDTIGPENGWSLFLSPKHDVSLLAYSTESLMRVWAIATILPEGQSPDSQLVSEPNGSPPYQTIEPTSQRLLDAPSATVMPIADEPRNNEKISSQPIVMQLDENEKFVRGLRVKTETKIRQRVGEDFGLPEIEREIKTSFAIDERGRIRSEQTGGVPGQIGTTEVRQQHEVAVYDGLLLRLSKGNVNEPANWGYYGRDKYRMPREVDPRNYLLEYNNEPLRQQVSGGKYEVIAKEPFQGREVFVLQTATTTRESDKTSYRGRILLDPALGYAAVYRVSQIRFDDLGPEWHDFVRSEVSDYRQTIGGIWVPGQATYTSFLVNREVVKAKLPIESTLQQEIRFLDWELNPEFTDDDFALTFPDGIFVMDESKTPESANP